MSDPDRELLDVYRSHLETLKSVAWKVLRAFPDEIEDVLQETWFRAQRAWPPRETRHAKAWLGTIAFNLAIGRLRRMRRANDGRVQPRKDGVHPTELVHCAGPAPDEVAARRQTARRLREAVAALPDGYRAIVRLRDFEGLSEHETSERLGLAVGTVKSQHHKAVARLREILKPRAA